MVRILSEKEKDELKNISMTDSKELNISEKDNELSVDELDEMDLD